MTELESRGGTGAGAAGAGGGCAGRGGDCQKPRIVRGGTGFSLPLNVRLETNGGPPSCDRHAPRGPAYRNLPNSGPE